MNREILFRARSVGYVDNFWVYGGLIQYDKDTFYVIENNQKAWDISHDGILIDPKTIGQYTGLTDKNGVKIFEGDILSTVIMKPSQHHYDGDYTEPKLKHVDFYVEYNIGEFVLKDFGNNCIWPIVNVLNEPATPRYLIDEMYQNYDPFRTASDEELEEFNSIVEEFGMPLDEILENTILSVSGNLYDEDEEDE